MTRRLPRCTGLLLVTLAGVVGAAEVRRAEDTTVSGRLVAIREGQLLVQPAAATAPTAVPLEDVVEVTLADAPATRPATARATTTRPATPRATTQPSSRPQPLVQTARRLPTTLPTATSATTSATTTAATTAANQPASGSRPWTLRLTTPDSLTLSAPAWTAGRISGTLGASTPIDLPVTAVAELWCGTADQVAAAKASGQAAATDDVAYATRDGKTIAVHGVAEGVEGGALRFKFGEQTRTIALSRLVGVSFAKPAATETAAAAPQQAITLNSGDSLPGRWTGVDDDALTLVAAWGQPLTVARRDAKTVTFRNGRVLSLSDLQPSDVKQTPYFDRLLPWKVDHGLGGEPLRLSDGPIARGLAVHARTILTFPLDGAFVQFRSHVGFQQPDGRIGQAVVRVTGDGRTLFEKADARGIDAPFDVTVNVQGVRRLSLEVDFGPNGDVGDRVVWGNARVLRPPSPAAGGTP